MGNPGENERIMNHRMNKPTILRTRLTVFAIAIVLIVVSVADSRAQGDGLLSQDGHRVFPIGCYELPKDDEGLQRMAEAGINLVRCGSRADLDRLAKLGMMGIMPLSLQSGPTDALREKVESVRNHPALAVWEGPDEVVWSFTAGSGLHRVEKVHKVKDAWWQQTPNAVKYAEEQAGRVIPNMLEAIQFVRSVDEQNRPVWINEASYSDTKYVRDYLDAIDITGCDIYPINGDNRRVARVGAFTERWNEVGRGKPVWMVLQAFSWNELGDYYGATVVAYPTFAESRFMAYDTIVHGAKAVLYWGSHYLKSEACRTSIYALTGELAALQPFLTAPNEENVRVSAVAPREEEDRDGVKAIARRVGREWLLVLVNESDHRHMAVEVTGLVDLEGTHFDLLYGTETATVQRGELLTRLQPYEVKVFATGREWETDRRDGRDFAEPNKD